MYFLCPCWLNKNCFGELWGEVAKFTHLWHIGCYYSMNRTLCTCFNINNSNTILKLTWKCDRNADDVDDDCDDNDNDDDVLYHIDMCLQHQLTTSTNTHKANATSIAHKIINRKPSAASPLKNQWLFIKVTRYITHALSNCNKLFLIVLKELLPSKTSFCPTGRKKDKLNKKSTFKHFA